MKKRKETQNPDGIKNDAHQVKNVGHVAAIHLTGDRQCHVAYFLPHTHPLEINDANTIPSTNVAEEMSCEETAAEINVDSRERHIVEHDGWIMGGMRIQVRPSAQGAEMTRKPERANVAKGELMK